MNKIILNALTAFTIALGLAGCDENAWNDHYLDGFEGGASYDDSEEVFYTLTDADYATISSEMKDIATNDADIAVAKAIGSNLYFDKNSVFPAEKALPVFLATDDNPYYLASNGSTIDVTYREAGAVPEELSAIAGAYTYTVTNSDYITVWESDEDYIAGFAPIASASKHLPTLLANALPDAQSGAYAIVGYKEADTNPVFLTEEEETTVYINETFSEDIGSFTINDVMLPEGSTYVWKHDSYGYMKASSYVGGSNKESESWLISPVVALSSKANAVLSFDSAWRYFASIDNAKEEASVWIREENGEWAKLNPPTYPENTSWTFYASGNIDLSSYNGKKVQIGFRYKSSTESCGTYEVKNVLLQSGNAESTTSRALASEVPTESKNAVYYFNGSKWSVADGVTILNPADYTKMGFSNNKLSDPEVYIPIYLKLNLPYAMEGDQQYAVYNNNKTDLFVYDGVEWSLNNNGLETVTGRFEKKDGNWTFVKYIGKAIFQEYTGEPLLLDHSYLIVSGNIAATVLNKTYNYGYIPTIDVAVANQQIVLANDASAYVFASSYDNDGSLVKAPESQFLIKDSYDRYLYLSGTYNSFNVKSSVAIEDGAIQSSYLWTATYNGDGTWAIANVANGKKVYFSSSYSNFAAYDNQSANDFFPSLFILNQ